MALSLFAPKVLRAEVVDGIDLEAEVLLTGNRITIGSGSRDDLVLGARHVVESHLTFIRADGSKTWEYFSSDRGQTLVDQGNPRTGTVRPGMWFNLGGETRISIEKIVAPADFIEDTPKGEKKTVPMGVALPLMGLMLLGVAFVTTNLGGSDRGQNDLATLGLFTGDAPIDPLLDRCIAAGLSPSAQTLAGGDPNAKDALFRAILNQPEASDALRQQLAGEIRNIIAESHLLARENKGIEASRNLRRLENVMPVGSGDCPILRAARFDLAILEMQGGR